MPSSPKRSPKEPAPIKKKAQASPAAASKPSVPAASAKKEAAPERRAHRHTAPTSAAATPTKLWMPKDRLFLAAGLLLAIVIFSSGLNGGFVFDDHLAILNNADTDARTPLLKVFLDDFWGHNLHAVVSNRSYRPLVVLSFRLQHMLMGYRHSALFLHLVNYVAAYLNACLVFYVARLYALLLARTWRSVPAATRDSLLYTLPAFAMALFLVHPVHVDAVTSIVGRCEIFYCFFGLLAFFTAHRFLTVPSALWRRAILLALVIALLIMCVLSKDSGIAFAALVMMHAVTLLSVKATSRLAVAVLCAANVGLVATYFSFRQGFIGSVDLRRSPMLRRSETPQLFVEPGLQSWLAIRWVIQMKNLQLLFFPTSFCCEYSYNCIPQLTSRSDPRMTPFLAVTVTVLACVLALVFMACKRRSAVAMVLLLSLLWIAIPYAPVSHLFVQIGTFVAERCLYGPSIGVVLFLTFFFVTPGKDGGRDAQARRVRCIPLVVLIILWSWLSFSQNTVWRSDITLFKAAVAACPNSGKAHAQLATAMVTEENGISSESEALFIKAYQLDSELSDVLYFLAIDAWQNKQDAEAAYNFVRGCAGDPLAMGKCYPLMNEIRKNMFPDKKPHELALDDAMIAKRNPDIAGKYREAAELVIRDQGDYCYARSLLFAAMKYWSFAGLRWRGDDVGSAMQGSSNFCDTARREAEVAEQCYTVQRPAEYARRNNTDAKVFKHGRIQRTLSRIVDAVQVCDTDWSQSSILTANTSVAETYPRQMVLFTSLATTVLDSFTTIYNTGFADANTAKKLDAKLLILEIALRRYCNAAQLAEDTIVTRRLYRMAPHELNLERSTFKANNTEWLKRIKATLQEVNALSPGAAQTQELLQKFSSCVPGLLNA